jgi:hypothetical protein
MWHKRNPMNGSAQLNLLNEKSGQALNNSICA